jgi:hypothetical protein
MPYTDKAKQLKYQREWMARRRAKYLEGKKCKHCGGEENLVFHHRDPKIKESHRIWSWAIPRLEAELKKCVVLCRTCHYVVHRTTTHGTRNMYDRYGCRCQACIDAASADRRRRKLKC